MGMKKISGEDEKEIARILQRWPRDRRLTWESLREVIALSKNLELSTVWSRQSLSASETIYAAYATARQARSKGEAAPSKTASENELIEKVAKLEWDLNELQKKYDQLLLRHLQVCNNASLLDGGIHLLDIPLPDNTKSQG